MKVIILLLVLSLPVNAVGVSTPWSNPEKWESSWQIFYAGRISGFANFIGKSILGGRIGQELKDAQKAREKELKNSIAKRMKEKYPLDHTLIYEDWLHGLNHYKNLENDITDPEDLSRLIDHLKKQEKNLKKKGKSMNKKFKEHIKDLEHIRDYWEDNQEEDNTEVQQLAQQTTITIIMGIMVMIVKLTAGVPA